MYNSLSRSASTAAEASPSRVALRSDKKRALRAAASEGTPHPARAARGLEKEATRAAPPPPSSGTLCTTAGAGGGASSSEDER